MLVQCLTTSITCLAFTLTRSWALTLVVLSAVPVLIFIQGLSQSILCDSAWDNLLLGVEGEREVTKEEVEEACRAAMVHEFTKDLPDGYETHLG